MLVLNYIHDPMCSWCWAFHPQWEALKSKLPASINVRYLLGGLAPDSTQAMPVEMQVSIQAIWRQIQQSVPGTKFNFDFWTQCAPRRSTYPSCRAVLAAKTLEPALEEAMITGIQKAYYRQAKNPSDTDTLVDLAQQLGINKNDFASLLNSETIQAQLLNEIASGRQLGAMGFPSLYLTSGTHNQSIAINYTDNNAMLESIETTLENWGN